MPVFREGKRIYNRPDIHNIRKFAVEQLGMFHPGIKRLVNPHEYPVGLELGLHRRKMNLILKARGYNENKSFLEFDL